MPSGPSRRAFMGSIGGVAAGAVAGLATEARATQSIANDSGRSTEHGVSSPGFEAFFDDLIPAQLDEHQLAGATVAVVANGEVQLTKGYGYANLETEEPVRADETLFPVASTSKAVTGTAVMRAVEAGHVDLETDVNEYLDEVTIPDTYGESVTLEHLGTHTAGFAPSYIGQYARERSTASPLGEVLAEDPPDRVRPPGEVAAYSNFGIALAGHAASNAAGSTFSNFVRRELFEPLGMERSTFRPNPADQVDGHVTNAYDFDEDAGEYRVIEVPYELRRPAGSMNTTATDMARFMLMHLQQGQLDGQQLLSAETVRGMHERRFSNHPAINGLGYMFLEQSRGDTRIISHGGALRGATSVMALFPEYDLGLFVAYNTTGAKDASRPLFDSFVETYAPPGDPEPFEPRGEPSHADEIAGWYRATRVPESPVKPLFGVAGTLEVRVDDDGTLVTAPTAPGVEPIRWVEIEPLVFQAVSDTPQVSKHTRMAFREEDGEITYAFLRGPTDSYARLAAYENPLLHLGLFLAFVLPFLSTTLGWTGEAIWRWVKDRPNLEGWPRRARWLAWIAGALLLIAPVGLIAWLAGSPVGLSYGLPVWVRAMFALPVLGGLGAVAALGASAMAWRDGYWGPFGRGHYTTVALVTATFAWLVAYWGLWWTPF